MKNAILYIIIISTSLITNQPAYGQWTVQNSGVTETLNDVCFIDELNGWVVGDNSTILNTTDGGIIWVSQYSLDIDVDFEKVIFLNNHAGYIIGNLRNDLQTQDGINGYCIGTKDGGATWTNLGLNTSHELADIFFLNENEGWITTTKFSNSTKLLHTVDGGATWETLLDKTPSPDGFGYCVAVNFLDENIGFLFVTSMHDNFDDTELYQTYNGGNTWDLVTDITPPPLLQMQIINENTIFGWGLGLAKTTDLGVNWSYCSLAFPQDFTIYDTSLIAVLARESHLDVLRLFISPANSFDWQEINISDDLLMNGISFITENKLIAVGIDGQILIFNNISTGVKERPNAEHIIDFDIRAYPNPFNPITTIKYKILFTDYVTIKVHDILGKEIATLVNENKNAGIHEVEFNAGKVSNGRGALPSGVYIYTINANGRAMSKKMILTK